MNALAVYVIIIGLLLLAAEAIVRGRRGKHGP